MICLDSTFIIDFLRNVPQACEKLREFDREKKVTTAINVAEILLHVSGKSRLEAQGLFEGIDVLSLDMASIEAAARIKEQLKGNEINQNDFLIAGTMIANGCTMIVTRNIKDFQKIKGLSVISY